MRSKLYYVQDTRNYVGNDMLWWGKGSSGYVTNIDQAEIYTEEEIKILFTTGSSRETDVIWPFDYINSIARRAVDMQQADRRNIVSKE